MCKKVNKIILYSQAVQSNLSNLMLNGSHEFCWITEVVGLSSHLCNLTLYNIWNYVGLCSKLQVNGSRKVLKHELILDFASITTFFLTNYFLWLLLMPLLFSVGLQSSKTISRECCVGLWNTGMSDYRACFLYKSIGK